MRQSHLQRHLGEELSINFHLLEMGESLFLINEEEAWGGKLGLPQQPVYPVSRASVWPEGEVWPHVLPSGLTPTHSDALCSGGPNPQEAGDQPRLDRSHISQLPGETNSAIHYLSKYLQINIHVSVFPSWNTIWIVLVPTNKGIMLANFMDIEFIKKESHKSVIGEHVSNCNGIII